MFCLYTYQYGYPWLEKCRLVNIFSRVHATLQPTLSVGRSVGPSIKNAISNLEKRNCISVKALLMNHTVLRICPSSVFSTHSFSFLKVTFFLTGQFSFSPFRKNHVAFSVWRPFVFIPVVCCLRITIVADKNVIFLFVITFSFYFMFSCLIEIWNDSLTLNPS